MKPGPIVVLIAAVDRRRAIGRGGGLLWHEREDQKHFRAVTMGHPVIMGRKTWDSLPAKFKPLPGRRNIVVTRNPAWRAEGADAVPSFDAAITLSGTQSKVFVIGGGELYATAMPRADELALTEIDTTFERADAFFPAFDSATFEQASRDARVTADGMRYAFVTYQRSTR